MGVVNITPDSFSDGGQFLTPDAAVAHAVRMLSEGADVVDLGAESTRPGVRVAAASGSNRELELGPAVSTDRMNEPAGAPAVSAKEEQARLLPVLEALLAVRPHAVVSVDTYKADTARAALQAGAEIINDVSGFMWDPAIAEVCAEYGPGVVLGHSRGVPDEWQEQDELEPDALLKTVRDGLAASLAAAKAFGISPSAVVLDPGYGFGKRYSENYALLARQAGLLELGWPLLAGLSRKSFLGRALADLFGGVSAPIGARENASLAAMTAAILNGASIVRVHSVRAAIEAARIADAVWEAKGASVAIEQESLDEEAAAAPPRKVRSLRTAAVAPTSKIRSPETPMEAPANEDGAREAPPAPTIPYRPEITHWGRRQGRKGRTKH